MGSLSKWLLESNKEADQTDINQKVEDTFGPNQCSSLRLTHQDTGELLQLVCDGKRCIHCSPRKQMTIQLQLQALGTNVYVARLTNLTELEKALERTKKQAQREGYTYRYQIVGDDRLGYIVVSDVELIDEQRYMQLDGWMKRILDLYRYARKRIRRSYALGRVSLVPLRRRANSGTAAKWMRRTGDTDAIASVEDITWDELWQEIDVFGYEQELIGGEPWTSPM